jgi:glycosyltransferase involved in cell wall biosynthesis
MVKQSVPVHVNSYAPAWHVRLLHHYDYVPDTRIVAALSGVKSEWLFQSIPGGIGHKYNRRWYQLIAWPRQLIYGFIQGLHLIGQHRNRTIVAAYSHLVLLPIVLMAMVIPLRIHLVYLGFIYTPRRWPPLDMVRHRYFRALLSRISLVICHSKYECAQYRELFGPRPRFSFAPFCINVPIPQNIPQGTYALSAGRSGRDYELLLRAISRFDTPLKIICDKFSPSQRLPENVEVKRHCYSADYLRILAGAHLVVVPLAVDQISAGQMVLLQAMAMGKPIIVTSTATTREYVTHKYNGWLIGKGDEKALCEAIHAINADPTLAQALGDNARKTYLQAHTIESQAAHFIRCLEELVGNAT